jgi:hypothetical protein
MLIDEYKEIVVKATKDLEQLDEFQSNEYVTLQEYYKITHRILDKMCKVTEYFQELIEQEINKL